MYMDQLLNQLYEYRDTLSRDNAHYRGSVRAGATGAIAPVDFQKYQIAPVIFEAGQGKNDMKFIQNVFPRR